MEPMDLDLDESLGWPRKLRNSSLSSETSDMDIDMSPSKHDLDDKQTDELPPGNPHTLSTLASVAGQDKKPNLSGLATAVKAGRKFKKTGYGIPEDDLTFSHFPEKGPAMPPTSIVHRKRAQINEVKSSLQGQNEKLQSSTKKSAPKRSAFLSCCYLVGKLLVVLAVCCSILFAAAYFISLQKQKCLLSRRFNARALGTDLESFVFGQHIASEIIPRKIYHYFNRLQRDFNENFQASDGERSSETKINMCKPLVMSFHGWTGVGKNFLSRIITDNFPYTTVNYIVIPLHFPHQALEHHYGQVIRDWILTNNTACSVNIVVIDEMDKAFPPVSDGIAGAIEALRQPCHLAAPTIILLLSNSYASSINRLFFQHHTQHPSESREKIPSSLFQSAFSAEHDNSWDSVLEDKHLIDAYVPFLPLEKGHVVQCIKRELVSKRLSTDAEAVDKILAELTFSTVAGLDISATGCKRVSDKVDYVMLGQG